MVADARAPDGSMVGRLPAGPASGATAPAGGPAVPGTSYGALAAFIRSRPGWTRQQLLRATGMSRTTLFERLDALFAHGYVYQAGAEAGRGPGRRSEVLRWDDRGRVVLVLDLGQTSGRVCVSDVSGKILRSHDLGLPIATDPQVYLGRLYELGDSLVGEQESLIGVAMGIPGPVNPATGVLGLSTTMPAWQSVPIAQELGTHWDVPVVIENDARALALGEALVAGAGRSVLAIKYATGIGAGLVDSGTLLEGSDGAAGDLGHVQVSAQGPLCTCGRHGCLAAWASGQALIRDLPGVDSMDDLLAMLAVDDAAAVAALDAATDRLAAVLATVVAMTNPDTLIFGGALGRIPRVADRVGEHLRNAVSERARASLTVSTARMGYDSAVLGLARKVVDLVYAPAVIDERIAAIAATSGPAAPPAAAAAR